VLLWALMVAALIAGGLAAAPSREGDRGPGGYLALRRFLAAMGLEVRRADSPPMAGKASFVLTSDLRDSISARKILRWVRSGGRLILADPGSLIAERVKLGRSRQLSPIAVPRRLAPQCPGFTGTQVSTIEVSTVDSVLRSLPAGSSGCFPAAGGFFMAARNYGKGQIVLMGGSSPLTNRMLYLADNPTLAYRLFAGFGPVVFGPPVDPSMLTAPPSAWSALPGPARSVVAMVCLALAIWAVVQGRRFGKPSIEQPASPIPSSQLVGAAAELYRAAKATEFAGWILRRGAAGRIAGRYGAPTGGDPETALVVAGRVVVEQGLSGRAFEPPDPRNDEELIALARDLTDLEETVVGP
jgi:hypothetical protein